MASIEITRQTEGKKTIDAVSLDEGKTDEILQKVLKNKEDGVQIKVDDIPGNRADEVSVKINPASLQKLSENGVSLTVATDAVNIELSKDELKKVQEKEGNLYFNIIPISEAQAKTEVVNNTITAKLVKQAAGNSKVEVYGEPMTIETNYQDSATNVTFSIKNITIPENKKERKEFLDNLAVYINHSDGTKELTKGKVVYDSNGKPTGLEIGISKFSTFTIVQISNSVPAAAKIKISGTAKPGNVLTASYIYTDAENDKEGNSHITWYNADDKKGTNKRIIAKGALTYKVSKQDAGKYITVQITPVAKTGNTIGKAVSGGQFKVAVASTVKKTNSEKAKKTKTYNIHVQLGMVGSHAYARDLAVLCKTNNRNVKSSVKKEGKYYRVYLNFCDKQSAKKVCENMKAKNYILNYYFCK